MARRQNEDAALVAEDEPIEQGELAEEEVEREVGTVVDAPAIPFERRKDGSIAYFTQEQAALQREVGS